jgi:uncharacterized protein (TIGR03083 family)
MDHTAYLAAIERDGAAFADAAQGHLDVGIPSCPEWDVSALVAHLGGVHRYATASVAAGDERIAFEWPEPPKGEGALIEWYREGQGALVAALAEPGTPAWVFMPHVPHTAGWWARRQALELAVHRWDVQSAGSHEPEPVNADLAVDGVDELFGDFVPLQARRRAEAGMRGTLHLHCTDIDGEWWIDFDQEPPVVRRQHAKGDTAVRGPASGLYLWLWNRQTPQAAGLEVLGRPDLVEAWSAVRI